MADKTLLGMYAGMKKDKVMNWAKLFQDQEALESGSMADVSVGKYSTTTTNDPLIGKSASVTATTDVRADANTLGEVTGMQAEIDANKKRRKEQILTSNAGLGGRSSILGGAQF